MNRIYDLKNRKTASSDYPHAVHIRTNIPVFDANTVNHSDIAVNLSLQELDINDPTQDPADYDLQLLSELCQVGGFKFKKDEGKSTTKIIEHYRNFIEEIVHSLSLDGPGVCIVENVFSQEYMDKFQAWVDDYLTKDTSSKKDHFAFGTNKRIWRVPEKLPSNLLYTYLRNCLKQFIPINFMFLIGTKINQ